jgi:hypothetical protein
MVAYNNCLINTNFFIRQNNLFIIFNMTWYSIQDDQLFTSNYCYKNQEITTLFYGKGY